MGSELCCAVLCSAVYTVYCEIPKHGVVSRTLTRGLFVSFSQTAVGGAYRHRHRVLYRYIHTFTRHFLA